MTAGYATLGELDALSIDDVQELWLYAEWEAQERARVEEQERRKAAKGRR